MASALLIACVITLTGAQAAALTLVDGPAGGSGPAAAIEGKDEIVYANLTANGGVSAVYVVNRFKVAEAGRVTDYGSYDSVVNLTDVAPLAEEGDAVVFEAGKGNFYYQGNKAAADLPWLFTIEYYLNGAGITPQELAGQSGDLEISLRVAKNPDADPVFSDNYVVQLSLTLDSDRCGDITAPGATIANAGKDTVIAYQVLPGEDADITVRASVSDFVMNGVEISALPFSMEFDLPDMDGMIDDFEKLPDAIADLNGGVGELSGGADAYKSGMDALEDGSAGIEQGLDALNKSAPSLTSASAQMESALSQMSSALASSLSDTPDISSLAQLPGSLSQIAGGLRATAAGLDASAAAGINAMADNLDGIAQNIAASLSALDSLGQLQQLADGLAGLSESYGQFHKGLTDYTDGVGAIDAGYKDFHSGLSSLADGSGDIADGIRKLYDGTSQLEDETAGLPETLRSEMDDMLDRYTGADFEPVSFVSPRNTDVDLVQFVLKCQGVQKPEKAPAPAADPARDTVLDRFLALFTKE
jgi:X-X-X-Leu-X-X-Gly heptad repeat protein